MNNIFWLVVWMLICFWLAVVESLNVNYKEGFIMFAVVSVLLLIVIAYFAVNYYRSKKRLKGFRDFGLHLICIPDGPSVWSAISMQLDALGLKYRIIMNEANFYSNSEAVRMVSHWDGKNLTRTYLIFNGCEIVVRDGRIIGQNFNGEVFQ